MAVLGSAADPWQLMWMGRYAEALDAIDDQLPRYRELAGRWPGLYRDVVADLLVQRSRALHQEFRDAEALTCAEEAVAILRELYAAKPARFARYLAGALGDLSDRHQTLGRSDQAQVATQEAERLRGHAPDTAASS